jgi:hypothetical protein
MQPSESRQIRRQVSITLAALALITVATASSAFAQAFAQWPKQCRADLGRMCRSVASEEDRTILTCLQDNEQKLSQRCRKVLQSYGHVPDTPAKAPIKAPSRRRR